MQTLSVGNIISGAMRIGMKNAGTILGAGIMWLLTIWIPYLNVGTTIAMLHMTIKLGRGESFSAMQIFDKEYRTNMGEFFLLYGLMMMGVLTGLIFAIIPGIILAYAWSQAFLLMEDRNMSPLEAIRASNKMTYGDKWTMFLGMFVLQLVILGATFIVATVIGEASQALSGLVLLVGYLCLLVATTGANGYIYGELLNKLDGKAGLAPDGAQIAFS
jgi:uncharacterized membrane protein